MIQRKVQLIAGTTYTVSIPKDWANKHRINKKSSVFLDENEDGSLTIFPSIDEKAAERVSISINIENQEENISHIIYAAYYMGIENITLFSRKEIQINTRNKIKSTINNLSGVEIVFEDIKKIEIKVLLDISKTNVNQLIFRTNLLIKSSVDTILSKGNIGYLYRNEDEIDRLHHLINKMIFISSKDPVILKSSGITNISNILSYSRISKKLENIADSLMDLGKYVIRKGESPAEINNLLKFLNERLSRDISLLIKKNIPSTHAKDMTEISRIEGEIEKIKDQHISMNLLAVAKFIIDIEEELMNLIYYSKILEGK